MLQIQTLTSDNISALVEAIRERLVGKYYRVSQNSWEVSYSRSGYYMNRPAQVRETIWEGEPTILIEDNLGVYFITLGAQLTFMPDGFEVRTNHKGRIRNYKEWTFKIDRMLS